MTRNEEVDAVFEIFGHTIGMGREYQEDRGNTLTVAPWGDVTLARLVLMAKLVGTDDIRVYGGTAGERDGTDSDATFIEWESATAPTPEPPPPTMSGDEQRATPSAADDWLAAARTMAADDSLSDDHRAVASELLQQAYSLRFRAYYDGAEAERMRILVVLRAALVACERDFGPHPVDRMGLQAAIGIVRTRHENGGG